MDRLTLIINKLRNFISVRFSNKARVSKQFEETLSKYKEDEGLLDRNIIFCILQRTKISILQEAIAESNKKSQGLIRDLNAIKPANKRVELTDDYAAITRNISIYEKKISDITKEVNDLTKEIKEVLKTESLK